MEELTPKQRILQAEGFCYVEEGHLIEDISAVLLTYEQQKWLQDHSLDIFAILRGFFDEDLIPEVAKIYRDWNDKLGKEMFIDIEREFEKMKNLENENKTSQSNTAHK